MSLVPKLRFKQNDGSDFPDWVEKKLGDISIINPKTPSLPLSFIYIDLESVEKGFLITKNFLQKEDAPSRAQRLLKNQDILFQMVRPYQQNNYFFNLGDHYVASTGYSQIRTAQIPKFLYYVLHTKTFLDNVMLRCTGTSYPAINSTDLSKIEIHIPHYIKEEQEKIAGFLTAVDELIADLTKKESLLQKYKKGVMQKIFSQEIRFKQDDGSDFPRDWSIVQLGDLIKVSRGGSPRPIQNYLTHDANGVNWIKIGDTSPQSKYITSSNEKIKVSGISYTRQVFKGDFLLSNSMSFGRPYILKIDGCIHDGWLVLQDYKNYFDTDYLYYLLSTDFVLKQYHTRAAGSSVLNLNKDIVEKIWIKNPSLPEQQKIANFLSSIDDQITTVQQQLEKTKQYKKALLQQLFI